MLIGVFDLEATDKDVQTARITQAAISIYDTDRGWAEVYHYSTLCYEADYPELNEVAAAITGISRTQLERFGVSAKTTIIHLLRVFDQCDYVAGHNIRNFDIHLLSCEKARFCIVDDVSRKYIDTRFDVPWPSHIETRKLLYLAAEYGFANPMAHSARHDVDATAYLLKQFDLSTVLARSKSPEVWIQAMVTYDTKEKAKAKKYAWNADRKVWLKQVKECDLDAEIKSSDFKVAIVNG